MSYCAGFAAPLNAEGRCIMREEQGCAATRERRAAASNASECARCVRQSVRCSQQCAGIAGHNGRRAAACARSQACRASHGNDRHQAGFEQTAHVIERATHDIELKGCASPCPIRPIGYILIIEGNEIDDFEITHDS